jgi:squalene-associated FAD-dependent desaturase
VSEGRFVVVGGGLAGIAAALTLADAGASVTLVERRGDLGGLTRSYPRHGLTVDNGQHVFLRCCTAYLGLLERLGVRDLVELQPRLAIPVHAPGRRVEWIHRSGLPTPLHLLGGLSRYRHLSISDRARVGRAALALRRLDPDDPALDQLAFGPWLHAHGQRDASMQPLWDLVIRPTVNIGSEEASLALATRVFRTGLLDTNDGADIGWSRVPLGELHGTAARKALDAADVEVVTSCGVDSVRPATRGVQLRAGSRSWTADAAVIALPHRALPAILPDEALAHLGDLRGLGHSPIVNVHLIYDDRVLDEPFIAAVDSPVQYVFDRTESSGLTRGQYLAISLSAADAYLDQPPQSLVATMAEAMRALLPRAARASLVNGFVTSEPHATFRGVPGTRALRSGPRTAVPGVLLAGAWTNTGWPATMEGAVRSGHTAATVALGGLEHEPHTALSNREVVS